MPTSVNQIRWMIRRDLPEIMAIERATGDWDQEQLGDHLRQRNCIGMVYVRNECVVGFMVYDLHKNSLHVHKLAVCPDHQAQYIGTAMVEKLIQKLTIQRRTHITIYIHERNVGAQKFLRAVGFKAVEIRRDAYNDGDEWGFEFRVPAKCVVMNELE